MNIYIFLFLIILTTTSFVMAIIAFIKNDKKAEYLKIAQSSRRRMARARIRGPHAHLRRADPHRRAQRRARDLQLGQAEAPPTLLSSSSYLLLNINKSKPYSHVWVEISGFPKIPRQKFASVMIDANSSLATLLAGKCAAFEDKVGSAATPSCSYIYVIGGCDADGTPIQGKLPVVEALSIHYTAGGAPTFIHKNTSLPLPILKFPRYGHTAAILNNTLYVAGGIEFPPGKGRKLLASIEIFTMVKGAWKAQTRQHLVEPRANFALFAYGENSLISVGGTTWMPGLAPSSPWWLSPASDSPILVDSQRREDI